MENTTLGAVAEYINGLAFKPEDWEDTGKPIIRIQNLTKSTNVINRTNKIFDDKYLIRDGDILFAWSASLGAHIWHGEDAWLNQHIFKVIPQANVNKMFLYYYLLHIVDNLYSKAHGSGMVHITLQPFKNTRIMLPCAEQQHRIVARIESLFSKLDEAKEKAQSVLDGFENRRAAILHKAFTGELTKNRNPKIVRLGDYLKPMETKRPSGEIFSYIDIDSIDNKHQIVKKPKIIFTKDAPSRASRAVHANDILFSMVRPYLKNIAYIDEENQNCIASTGFYVCSTKEGLASKYLFHFLCSKDAIDYLMTFMKGDNSPSIKKDDLLNMKMILPSLYEQHKIVRILDSLLSQEQQAKQAAEAVIEQIDIMKKSILARTFRGELGTNDPNDKPARIDV